VSGRDRPGERRPRASREAREGGTHAYGERAAGGTGHARVHSLPHIHTHTNTAVGEVGVVEPPRGASQIWSEAIAGRAAVGTGRGTRSADGSVETFKEKEKRK